MPASPDDERSAKRPRSEVKAWTKIQDGAIEEEWDLLASLGAWDSGAYVLPSTLRRLARNPHVNFGCLETC